MKITDQDRKDFAKAAMEGILAGLLGCDESNNITGQQMANRLGVSLRQIKSKNHFPMYVANLAVDVAVELIIEMERVWPDEEESDPQVPYEDEDADADEHEDWGDRD
jgi:hypothetical protein